MNKQSILLTTILIFILTAYSPIAYSKPPKGLVLKAESKIESISGMYSDTDYGIKLVVNDKREDKCVYKMYKMFGGLQDAREVSVSPDLESTLYNDIYQHMQIMGFKLNENPKTDYILTINITGAKLTEFPSLNRYMSELYYEVMMQNSEQQYIYPKVASGGFFQKDIKKAKANDISDVFTKGYNNLLESFDWNTISSFLKISNNPSEEKNKQVDGSGNTALESTIIRWYIVSAPAGADVQWRVVSSTPEVKNTNQSFLGSTPYESTESFDIIGLTYNNSGNVQIEISCEKPGYITQRKRFNVRQAIDQKEISTKFNLIKED